MPSLNDYRPPVFRNPYSPRRGGSPIRGFSQSQQRGNTAFEPTYAMPSPQDAAMGLFNIGVQADSSGNLNPTQDFGGMMGAASSQINSMTRGVRPGQFSSLGKPMGTMYAQNPGFFRGGNDFGSKVAQRNQAMMPGGGIPNPLQPSYQGVVKAVDQAAAGGGTGTSVSDAVAALGRDTSVPTMEQRRAPLQEAVDAKRMLGQATGDIPTVNRSSSGATISGKYGTGSSTFSAPGTPRKEGLINGKPASEVLQGLANKPGIARAGDRFQPQKSTPAETKAMNTALSKLPMKNPLLKR
jgi:hypothetical protein